MDSETLKLQNGIWGQRAISYSAVALGSVQANQSRSDHQDNGIEMRLSANKLLQTRKMNLRAIRDPH